jgi:curved DNA-binding protein CbpA
VSALYDTLGVAQDASQDEVKTAFRRAAAAAHPDREGGDAERMAAINRAYETLGDPDKRAEYDATGETDSAAKLEDEARSRLVALFQAVLDAGDEGDLMGSCRMLLGNARAEIANNHRASRARPRACASSATGSAARRRARTSSPRWSTRS